MLCLSRIPHAWIYHAQHQYLWCWYDIGFGPNISSMYRKCLKRWRSVNQQIPCYTNYIIVWGTFYSYNSACIPGAASLTMAGNCLWSPDAPDDGCLASRSEDISDRCKHPVHWVWHSLLMYIIPHWPLLPWEYPQTAKALLAVVKGLILASHSYANIRITVLEQNRCAMAD